MKHATNFRKAPFIITVSVALFAVSLFGFTTAYGYGSSGSYGGGGGGGVFSGPYSVGYQVTPTTPTTGGEVLGASTYNFRTNFGYGANGEDVVQLQTLLKAEGFFTGPVTGHFRGLTFAAVKKFQAANHILPRSGFVGPLTRAVLNKGIISTN